MVHKGMEKNPAMDESASLKTIDELNSKASQLVNIDNQKSLKYAEQAHQLCISGKFSSHPYKEGLANSLNVMCEMNLIHGNTQLSMELSEKAMALYKAQNNLDGQAKVLSIQGYTYFVTGNYPKAIDSLLISLQLARETANLAQQGRTLSFLATAYNYSGDEEKSVETFEKSIEISSRVNDEITLALTYNNMAMGFSEMGKNDEALNCSQKSLKLCDKLGLDGLKIPFLDTIGNIYMEIKDYTQAEKYFSDVINQLRNSNLFQHVHMVSLLNLGRIHLELGKEESAISYLIHALKIAEEMDSKLEQFRIHRLLSESYEKKTEFKESLLHYKKFQSIEKMVYNQEGFEKIQNLELAHKKETAVKEAEIYQLKNVELKQKMKEMSRLNSELQKAFDEIKTLKGIIPICSGCKKIRDDSGYWNRIESYIQKHSEAEFSHGMCPECLDEYYGKEDWYIELKNSEAKE